MPRGTDQLLRLVYISTAVSAFTADELNALVTEAGKRNRARGITGMLCYYAGDFLQIIEGPREHLLALWERVQRDPRHTFIQVLQMEPTDRRLFGPWGMGLCDMHSDNGTARADFRAIASFLSHCRGLDGNEVAMGLLAHFRSLAGAPGRAPGTPAALNGAA